jgi:hypothetical protein
MRNMKTLVVAAGAAVVLGGVGVGVAQASGPATGSTRSVSSVSSTHQSHEAEARGRVAEGETHAPHQAGTRHEAETRHEPEARGRTAEGETHPQHTGTDDTTTSAATDDHGTDN